MSVGAVAAPTRAVGRGPSVVAAVSGWLLVVACLGLLLTGLIAGERQATYDELRRAVADGDVDSVVVTGGTEEGYLGRQGVTVHWREGIRRYQAPVVEQHPQRRTATHAGVPVVYSVERDLTDQDVTIERRPRDVRRYNEVYGWQLPPWTSVATFVIGLTGLLLLIGGPQPRRATRWAWFWLMWTAPPVGFVAFLLLGGLLSPRPRADVGRRLTGGWAFLLAIVVGAAFSAVVTASGH